MLTFMLFISALSEIYHTLSGYQASEKRSKEMRAIGEIEDREERLRASGKYGWAIAFGLFEMITSLLCIAFAFKETWLLVGTIFILSFAMPKIRASDLPEQIKASWWYFDQIWCTGAYIYMAVLLSYV